MDNQDSSPELPPEQELPAPAVAPKSHGYRIGPFYFVPEIRARRDDPWAHRKGEPRIFALFWSAYLMIASLTTLFAIRSTTIPKTEQYSWGAAALLTCIMLGIGILWPLCRLTQAPPKHALGATLADIVVLLLPVQAIIWPLPVLTFWSFQLVTTIALMSISWTALISAIIAWAIPSRDALTRIVAMSLCLAIVGTAPLFSIWWLATGHPAPPPESMMLASPFTAIWALLQSPSNWSPIVTDTERLAAIAPLVPASIVWIALAITGRTAPLPLPPSGRP